MSNGGQGDAGPEAAGNKKGFKEILTADNSDEDVYTMTQNMLRRIILITQVEAAMQMSCFKKV